jgi:hypothetical protein
MNEADRLDPNYEVNFYGTHFLPLSAIKLIYDPLSLLYCPTCVGKIWLCECMFIADWEYRKRILDAKFVGDTLSHIDVGLIFFLEISLYTERHCVVLGSSFDRTIGIVISTCG